MEIKKSILMSMWLLAGLSILSWCTKEEIKPENNNEHNINQSNDQNQILDNNKDNQEKIISIWHGCIWCGKCTQIAPSNFAMQGKNAIVISQENKDSQEVKNAIQRCPVRVIEVL